MNDKFVDERFHKISGVYKITEIANFIGCNVDYDTFSEDEIIYGISSLTDATSGSISFLSNKKYLGELKTTKASACIVPENIGAGIAPPSVALLKAKNPYFAYAKLVDIFYSNAKHYKPSIHRSASIASSARIGKNCYIGPNVVVEDRAIIGDDAIIEAGVFIDHGVVIGNRAKIYNSVSISYSIIGDDVIILPGARIGQDGFGFATEAGLHYKIYHTGRVIVGNNVEIGANTTIDRGSMHDTVIEDLCRIDNLVQIGHNVAIGRGSILVAQVGIAGSSKIGKYCALGGQVGISGHVKIGDMVQIAGQGGVMQNVDDGAILGGSPAVPIRDWHRQSIIMRKLVKESK
jgi:UDP-3-O-[3-hydroxymyristoyl] glucosamine N-acyltransferase